MDKIFRNCNCFCDYQTFSNYNSRCVLSQNGPSLLWRHIYHFTYCGLSNTTFTGRKEVPLWELSQNNCVLLRPHEHQKMVPASISILKECFCTTTGLSIRPAFEKSFSFGKVKNLFRTILN